jgi:hypothetical protein
VLVSVAVERSVEDMVAERAEPRIASDLDAMRVPTDSLRPHPENPRRGDVAAITESLLRFGQVRPIVATLDGVVVAGNHVLAAVRELGWPEVAAVREDLNEDDARAYLVADNRLAELGTYDDAGLAAVLESLGPGGVAGTGYRGDDLDAVLSKLRPEAPASFQAIDPDALESDFQCPGCGYEWSGKPKPERADA